MTAAAARAYLEFLYTPAAQAEIAGLFFRTRDPDPADGTLPNTLLRATDPRFGLGDWAAIQKDFFAEGGIFDQIYRPGS